MSLYLDLNAREIGQSNTSLIAQAHLQDLQHLLLPLQRDRVELAAGIFEAALCDGLEPVPAYAVLLQGPREAKLPDHRVQGIAQVCLPLHERVLGERGRGVRVVPERIDDEGLLLRVELCVEFLHGGEAYARRFGVGDADGAKLVPDAVRSACSLPSAHSFRTPTKIFYEGKVYLAGVSLF